MKMIQVFYEGSYWKFEHLFSKVLFEVKENTCLYIEKMLPSGETSTIFIFKKWDRIEISEE